MAALEGGGRRVVVVSNRAPYKIIRDASGPRVSRSIGGLVSALEPLLVRDGGRWVAWMGDEDARRLEQVPDLPFDLLPLRLRPWEEKNFYYGFSNRVLWPVAHSMPDRAQMVERQWLAYRYVNRRFARAALRAAGPGDVIWVHDYQLARVPLEIRNLLPSARVAHFWHIPFPGPATFRRIPWAPEVLKGLLGADVVGFHTGAYARNFLDNVSETLEGEVDVQHGEVHWDGRVVRVGRFPIGIDFDVIDDLARRPENGERARRLREELGYDVLLVGVDRLDYTKGIAERIRAVERLLEDEPTLRGRIGLVQIAAPSRTRIRAYRVVRREVEAASRQVNARFGRGDYRPVRLMLRPVPFSDLVPYFIAADAVLVTPIRDGMNLVAKEYAACRTREDGAVILSRFAGAAEEMDEAHLVDPRRPGEVAAAIRRAITEPPTVRRRRMRSLRARVRRNDLDLWLRSFLGAVPEAAVPAFAEDPPLLPGSRAPQGPPASPGPLVPAGGPAD